MAGEIDHLDGTLFTDRLKDARLLAFEDEAEHYLDSSAGSDDEEEDDAEEGEA